MIESRSAQEAQQVGVEEIDGRIREALAPSHDEMMEEFRGPIPVSSFFIFFESKTKLNFVAGGEVELCD